MRMMEGGLKVRGERFSKRWEFGGTVDLKNGASNCGAGDQVQGRGDKRGITGDVRTVDYFGYHPKFENLRSQLYLEATSRDYISSYDT
jgi:hypothetical protein